MVIINRIHQKQEEEMGTHVQPRTIPLLPVVPVSRETTIVKSYLQCAFSLSMFLYKIDSRPLVLIVCALIIILMIRKIIIQVEES